MIRFVMVFLFCFAVWIVLGSDAMARGRWGCAGGNCSAPAPQVAQCANGVCHAPAAECQAHSHGGACGHAHGRAFRPLRFIFRRRGCRGGC